MGVVEIVIVIVGWLGVVGFVFVVVAGGVVIVIE